MRQYYKPALLETQGGVIIDCEISNDGFLYRFLNNDQYIISILSNNYPHADRGGWYFNHTRDRYIAEVDSRYIYANPQFIIRHFVTSAY